MGKPKSLKSSMKAIQEALSSFKPIPPICMQQSRTDSFRDLYNSFNSIYYTPPSSSSYASSFSSSGPKAQEPEQQPPLTEASSFALIRAILEAEIAEEEEEEEGLNPAGSCCSSSSPSNHPEQPLAPTNPSLCNKRFFFSPSATKSIAGEANPDAGRHKMRSSGDPPRPSPPEPDFAVEPGSAEKPCFCAGSVPTAVLSFDPYRDFRCSMEEMVEAHGLSDWPGLQELLRCYLDLNDRTTHEVIVLAFVDLLMRFAPPEKDRRRCQHRHHFSTTTTSSSSTSVSSSSYTTPLQLCSSSD